MNKLVYPIQNHNTDIIVQQFNNYDISTSYFLNYFKEISPFTINKCAINNKFVDDIIELISLIKITPLTSTNEHSLNSSTINDYTNLNASLSAFVSNKSNSISSNNLEINLFANKIDKFYKIYRSYRALAYWNLNLVDNANRRISMVDYVLSLMLTVDQAQIDIKNNAIPVLRDIAITINDIQNNTYLSKNDKTLIDTCLANYLSLNYADGLGISYMQKIYILFKYITNIDNGMMHDRLLNLLDKITIKYADFEKKEYDAAYHYFAGYANDQTLGGTGVPLVVPRPARSQISQLIMNDIQHARHNTATKSYYTRQLGALTYTEHTTLFYIEDSILTYLVNIHLIFSFLRKIQHNFTFYNRIKDLINANNEEYTYLESVLGNYYTTVYVAPRGNADNIDMLIHEIEYYIRIIISDVNMPDDNGITFAPYFTRFRFNSSDEILASINNIRILINNTANKHYFSTMKIATYLMSRKFARDMADYLCNILANTKSKNFSTIERQITNNTVLFKKLYTSDILNYLRRPSNDTLNRCFEILNAADIHEDIFSELFEILHNEINEQPTYLLLNPVFDPNQIRAGPIPDIVHVESYIDVNLNTPVNDGIAKTWIIDAISPHSISGSASSTSVGPSLQKLNYSNSILTDLNDDNFTFYDIIETYEPELAFKDTVPSYRQLINIHMNGCDLNLNTIKNTFICKYKTSYSRLYLLYNYIHILYNKYEYIIKENKFQTLDFEYEIDNRVPILLECVYKPKIDLLEELCAGNDQYLNLDNENKKVYIDEFIKSKSK